MWLLMWSNLAFLQGHICCSVVMQLKTVCGLGLEKVLYLCFRTSSTKKDTRCDFGNGRHSLHVWLPPHLVIRCFPGFGSPWNGCVRQVAKSRQLLMLNACPAFKWDKNCKTTACTCSGDKWPELNRDFYLHEVLIATHLDATGLCSERDPGNMPWVSFKAQWKEDHFSWITFRHWDVE